MKNISQHIKLFITGLTVALLASFSMMPLAASADATSTNNSVGDACAGVQQLDSSQTCNNGSGQSTVQQIIKVVVNLLSWVVGVVAVIAIILSGFRYVTAGGDSGKISAAKTSLIYALVGLVIVALAQFLVYFTLNQGNAAVNGTCASNSSLKATDPQCK